MGTGVFNAGGNPAMDKHPIQGGVQIFLVGSCYGNRDKLRPDGGATWLVCRFYLLPTFPLSTQIMKGIEKSLSKNVTTLVCGFCSQSEIFHGVPRSHIQLIHLFQLDAMKLDVLN